MEQRIPVGIDLSTANIYVAYWNNNKWELIREDSGTWFIPSYVAFTDSGLLVGEAAQLQATENSANTIFDVVRLIGRRYSDPLVTYDMMKWLFKVVADPENRLQIELEWKGESWQLTPVQICSMILIEIKKRIETILGTIIADIVVTVPVHFNYEQRRAIKEASIIADLNVVEIISATAARAMFHHQEMLQNQQPPSTSGYLKSLVLGSEYNMIMIIFDLVVGTVDVSLVTIKDDISCNVRATASYHDSSMNKANFNESSSNFALKCTELVKKCMESARIGIDAVREINVTDDFALIPKFQDYFQQNFKRKNLIINGLPNQAATAYGAANQAFYLIQKVRGKGAYIPVHDATPLSFELSSSQGKMKTIVCVPKNTNIPYKVEKNITSNKKPHAVHVYEVDMDQQKTLLGVFKFPEISSTFCNINVCFEMDGNGTLTVVAQDFYSGAFMTMNPTSSNNISDSQQRVWGIMLYKDSEKGITKVSPTESLTRSDSKWNSAREKIMADKGHREIMVGQSRIKYVEPEEYAIGIDFGTTYSRVAVYQRYSVRIFENEYGSHLTASSVAFNATGRSIGDTVHKEQVTEDSTNTIPNIKRLIGRCISDKSIMDDSKFLPYTVKCGDENRCMVSVCYKGLEKLFAPEEIAAMVLSKMKETAEADLKSKVSKAVISVPASFSDSQRKAIKDAGTIAGLEVLQLLNEPTAAAIAYYMQKNCAGNTIEKTLLIFDLGGGNLDVSIVKIKESAITVQAIDGDTNLGGEDFDNNMVCHFVKKFRIEKNKDISNKPKSLRRLRAACEKAKRVLSINTQTVVQIDALDEGIDFYSVITRKEFEELNGGLFQKSIGCVERCLEDAKTEKNSVDEVVLVGGSTRIPKMQRLLQEFFNKKELNKSVNADEAVVYGAAVQAAILSIHDNKRKAGKLELRDVSSLSFVMENKDGTAVNSLIPKHTQIPAKKELTFHSKLSSFSVQVQEYELASTTVFNLSGIVPNQRGDSKVNLLFEVDESGILNLTAEDTSAAYKSEIVISKENGGLRKEDIQKMVEAAARYKEEDEQHKIRAAELYGLENLAYRIKRDPKIPQSHKESIEKEANEAIAWLETNRQVAEINDINHWKVRLETIKHDAMSSLESKSVTEARS